MVAGKVLSSFLKPKPKPEPKKRGPLGGVSKKIKNPLIKPKADESLARERDLRFDKDTLESIKERYGDSGSYEEVTGRNYSIPKKLGEFYSPVRDTVKQMNIGKQGSTGQTIEAFLNKRSPSVSGSELSYTRLKLDPKKKYSKEEVLAFENLPEGYDIRVREQVEAFNVEHEGQQRQRVLDAPRNYFEITIHAPRVDPEVEQYTKGHFPVGVVTHARVSRRQTPEGEEYLLIEEIQSDAARMAGIKPPEEVAELGINHEFEEALTPSVTMNWIINEDMAADISDNALGVTPKIQKDLEHTLDRYQFDPEIPFNKVAKPFYINIHKKYNDPNFLFLATDEDSVFYDGMTALKGDTASGVNQNIDIPKYNLAHIKLAEDLVDRYKNEYSFLKDDSNFDVEKFIDKSDSQNQRLVDGGIKKIHAYAIEKHGNQFIDSLPYDKTILQELKKWEGSDSTVGLNPDGLEGLNEKAITRVLTQVEEDLFSPMGFPDQMPMSDIINKEQVPVNTKTETMLKGLQATIALAKEQGLTKIVMPNYRKIAELRGDPNSKEAQAFKDLYEKSFKKAMNILSKESKGTIKLNVRKLKHVKDHAYDDWAEPSAYLDDMPYYGGAESTEELAYEIDISDFEFDPKKDAFRFSKGGIPMQQQQLELFDEGGLRDEGGTVEPTSGNDVPSGAMKKEVADDIPAMLSEGEFVFPADVVRFIGLEKLMTLRQEAKQGLKMMEEMGQMGNSEEATVPDDIPFGMADIVVMGSDKGAEPKEMAEGGFVYMAPGGLFSDPRYTSQQTTPPVMSDEDKKEIEDALTGASFGDVTMRRYVNADGDVMYIPFIGDVPQGPIPEGYSPSDAPTAPSGAMGGQHTTEGSSREYQGEPNVIDQMTGLHDSIRDQSEAALEKAIPLEEMTDEQLVAYYEQFHNPINKYASVLVGLINPLMGLATGFAQQWSLKNGPRSLDATEKMIVNRMKQGSFKKGSPLYDKIVKAREYGKKNGYGPTSLLSGLKNWFTGKANAGDTKAKTIASELDKMLKGGGHNPKVVKSILDDKDLTEEQFIFDYGYGTDNINDLPLSPKVKDVLATRAKEGRGDPYVTTAIDPFAPATTGYTPQAERQTIKPTQQVGTDRAKLEGTSAYTGASAYTPTQQVGTDRAKLEGQSIEPTKDTMSLSEKRRLGIKHGKDAYVPDYGFRRADQIEAQVKRTKDNRGLLDFTTKKKHGISMHPDIVQTPAYKSGDIGQGLDRGDPTQWEDPSRDEEDSGGNQGNWGDYGNEPSGFGYTPPDPTPVTTTSDDSWKTNTWSRTGADDTSSDSLGMGAWFNKGGLAKPKAKPKRMKKGGLASSKKKK